MIEILRLQKSYKNHLVLNIKYYKFLKGCTYLLIGENGSGKSTLLKLMLGFIRPTEGNINAHGVRFAYAPEIVTFPDFIRVQTFLENLWLMRNEQPIKLKETLSKWGLNPQKLLNHLSKGMKQKVNLLQALLSDVDAYLFDEPLNGLDKASQQLFLDAIVSLRNKDATIIVTTHFPESYQAHFDVKVQLRNGDLYETC